MSRFTMNFEEVTDPAYANAGIPFEPAEPMSIKFKIDDPDSSKRYQELLITAVTFGIIGLVVAVLFTIELWVGGTFVN